MTRTFDEQEFFKLLKIEKPNVIYTRESGTWTKHTTFWFTDKDGVTCEFQEDCIYCIERIQERIKKLGIEVIGCCIYH